MVEYGPEWIDDKARAYIAGTIGFNALPPEMVRAVKHRAQQIMGLEPEPTPEPELTIELKPEPEPKPKPKPKKKPAAKKKPKKKSNASKK
jgi:outer membrane biosynthesis protein TonB